MPLLGRRAFATGSALAGLSLAGCGFHPLYAPDTISGISRVRTELAAISVANIPERPGQLLRQALQTRLSADETDPIQHYDLSVSFGISGEAIAIQPDSTATRERLVGTAQWKLLAQAAPKSILASGVARSLDDLNFIDQQPFASDLQNEAVQRRLATALADQIVEQIASYFATRAVGVPDRVG